VWLAAGLVGGLGGQTAGDPVLLAEVVVRHVGVAELADDLLDIDHPPEVRSLGRTLRRWRHQIVGWHRSRVSNGPTEAVNNLIKRIKRVGFGFRQFAHYRLRVLLYAGRPNWDPINIIDPAQIR